jgi:hypothetical protein
MNIRILILFCVIFGALFINCILKKMSKLLYSPFSLGQVSLLLSLLVWNFLRPWPNNFIGELFETLDKSLHSQFTGNCLRPWTSHFI